MMKKIGFVFVAATTLGISCQPVSTPASKQDNTEESIKSEESGVVSVTAEEQAAGYKLLFNGKDTEGWYIYHKDTIPGWHIADGILSTKGGNGDLVTKEEFESFELIFDWKLPKAGNSGVMYMVQDLPEADRTWHTGVEYQLIDEKNWTTPLQDAQKPGAAYDLYPPLVAAAKEVGEWNTGKIICQKGKIEHYLNGQKTAEYVWNSEDFNNRVAKSKFKDKPFAKKIKGRIVMQDHGQAVAFKNVKIRGL